MPNRFELALTTITNLIDTHIDETPSLIANRCVLALDSDTRNVFVTALFGILTDDTWEAALNAAVDAGYDPWCWTDSGRPTDTDRVWMICHHWAERWLATRRHKRVVAT